MRVCWKVASSILKLGREASMIVFAHHMAVELFGREFSPQTPLEHICAFGAVGLILGLATYGAWSLVAKLRNGNRVRRRVDS
jgi:hypothetical protein